MINSMNQEQPINQEQGIELEFWDRQEFWRQGRPISERRRLSQGETVPLPEKLECFDGHFWKVIETQPVVGIVGTPPVTLVFCRYIGPAKQSLS